MKLRITTDNLNIHMSVEFLTNAIMGGDAWLTLGTEMGNLAIEIVDKKTHNAKSNTFGIDVCRFNKAPMTTFVGDLIHSGRSEEIHWYLSIPYVEGQTKDFTRVLAARALSTAFLFEAVEDSQVNPDLISNDELDLVFAAYWKTYQKGDGYTIPSFNRELVKLSVTAMQRHGQNYRSFMLANREVLRMRAQRASSKLFRDETNNIFTYEAWSKMKFGGDFYRCIFAIILGSGFQISGKSPLEIYMHVTSRDFHRGGMIDPIYLIKICLLGDTAPQ